MLVVVTYLLTTTSLKGLNQARIINKEVISYFQNVQNKKYGNVVSISRLTGKCAAQKIKNFCSSSLWTCLHHMVILRSQNKIIDFLII